MLILPAFRYYEPLGGIGATPTITHSRALFSNSSPWRLTQICLVAPNESLMEQEQSIPSKQQ